MEAMEDKQIRVEIAETTLLRLLAGGQVRAADFRCLDCESKACLWRICLQSCGSPMARSPDRVQAPKPAGCPVGKCCHPIGAPPLSRLPVTSVREVGIVQPLPSKRRGKHGAESLSPRHC